MNNIVYSMVHHIRINTHYEHDCHGRVVIVDIVENTGDKQDRIPYFVEFKSEFGEVEAQGINGFIYQARKCL
ncbi:hypothetical protein LCGC14_0342300 [marine sediment metagenome]|uniref:Uncharacterized protein n=1 Tax=marine sediment metagenome TaxID=412755 RepID=A0A0F9WL12_9ZZZZ